LGTKRREHYNDTEKHEKCSWTRNNAKNYNIAPKTRKIFMRHETTRKRKQIGHETT